MKVRCKFKCTKKILGENGTEIILVPVTSGSEENSNFFKWTPYGEFRMGTVSDSVAEQFIPSKQYYIDIIVVE